MVQHAWNICPAYSNLASHIFNSPSSKSIHSIASLCGTRHPANSKIYAGKHEDFWAISTIAWTGHMKKNPSDLYKGNGL